MSLKYKYTWFYVVKYEVSINKITILDINCNNIRQVIQNYIIRLKLTNT